LRCRGRRADDPCALTDTDLESIRYYHFAEGTVAGVAGVVSRTGYTGEDGFELYLPAEHTAQVWRRLLEVGQVMAFSLQASARATRSGSRWAMRCTATTSTIGERRSRPDSAGSRSSTRAISSAATRCFVSRKPGCARSWPGSSVRSAAFPRHGYAVHVDGEPSGEVTSGIVSPMLQQGIGMAYVPADAAKPGTRIDIMVRDKAIPAEIVRPPFYKDGSVRK
jgi:aminomethyltransferase